MYRRHEGTFTDNIKIVYKKIKFRLSIFSELLSYL